MKEQRLYTIYLGDKLWENCIDDMNTTEIWAVGGMLWESKEKALACIKNLKHPAYDLENKDTKFSVVELFNTK